jgi:hypothetical protein
MEAAQRETHSPAPLTAQPVDAVDRWLLRRHLVGDGRHGR